MVALLTGQGGWDVAFCTTCGQPANTGDRFCTACGAPIASGADPGGHPALDEREAPGDRDAPRGREMLPGLAEDPDPEVDEAFGGLFSPRRADRPANRGTGSRGVETGAIGGGDRPGDTARLPAASPGGAPGWPGQGQVAGPGGWSGYGPDGGSGRWGPYGPAGSGPGWGEPIAGRPAARRTRRVVIAVLVAALAVVAAAGGVLGFETHARRPVPRASAARNTPSGRVSPPGVTRGSMVTVAPGVAGNPAAGPITRLLTAYFTAINSHDFSGYQALLDSRMRRSVTLSKFAAGYRSTTDSAEKLVGISATADGRTAAAVTFSSHQDPAESPDHAACTSWAITLFLERSGRGFLIGQPAPGYHAVHHSCS